MEAMLGISLYGYLYLKLAKMLHLSYYHLCLLSNKIGEEGRIGSAWKQGGSGKGDGGTWSKQYTHMNKWTIKKRKFRNKYWLMKRAKSK
jgi:hypothetical protein